VSEPQVRQIAVSRAQKVGGYHMMKALNPVYLIDFEGKG
jgi:precorrin-6B methylase 2